MDNFIVLHFREQCYQILSHRKKHGRFQDNAQTERTMRVRARAGAQAGARQGGREGGRATGFNKGRRDGRREGEKREAHAADGRTDGSRARARILSHHGRGRLSARPAQAATSTGARAIRSPSKAAFQGHWLYLNKTGFPSSHCFDLPHES